MDSPLARQLLGKRLDDEILLRLPEENKRYDLIAIEYRPQHS